MSVGLKRLHGQTFIKLPLPDISKKMEKEKRGEQTQIQQNVMNRSKFVGNYLKKK